MMFDTDKIIPWFDSTNITLKTEDILKGAPRAMAITLLNQNVVMKGI